MRICFSLPTPFSTLLRTYVPCVYRFKAVVDTDRFVVKTFDRRVSVSSYRTPVPSDTYLEMLQEVSSCRETAGLVSTCPLSLGS